MSMIKTPLELYRHLPRTNCGRCGAKTCLAFAAAVIAGEKRLSVCPDVESEAAARLEMQIERPANLDRIREEQLQALRKQVAGIDLPARAERIGARPKDGSLVVTCLGREFEVDAQGGVASQCHTHSWFSLPLLDYVLHCEGAEPTGRWVPLRELEHGGTWAPLFQQRCERPMKEIADAYSDLFADLVALFNGTSSADVFGSDISVVLHPFPRVPLLICYWRPEGDLVSRLHLFFDAGAERNLPIGSLFTLGTGLARMFEKIMSEHVRGKRE